MTTNDATPATEPLFEIKPGGYELKLLPIGLVAGLWLIYEGQGFHRTLGILCIAAIPVALARVWLFGRRSLTCYRAGMKYGGRFIAYKDIENLTVSIQDVHYEAARFRVYKFSFQGSNAEGAFHIRMRWLDRFGHSEDVDYVIRAASAPIVDQMRSDLQRSGGARWCRVASFDADAITLTRSGRRVRYEEIASAKLAEGLLRGELVVRCRDGTRFKIDTKEENFYPGYYFLLGRISSAAAPEDLRADVFEGPGRRLYFLVAGGLLAVALAMLSLPLLAPVDAGGIAFLIVFVGGCLFGAGFFVWKAIRAKRPR